MDVDPRRARETFGLCDVRIALAGRRAQDARVKSMRVRRASLSGTWPGRGSDWDPVRYS